MRSSSPHCGHFCIFSSLTFAESIPLENIDAIRDSILKIDGNVAFNISKTNGENRPPYTNFAKRKPINNKLNTTDPQYGLCIKTYNSDLFQNWIVWG